MKITCIKINNLINVWSSRACRYFFLQISIFMIRFPYNAFLYNNNISQAVVAYSWDPALPSSGSPGEGSTARWLIAIGFHLYGDWVLPPRAHVGFLRVHLYNKNTR